MALLGLRETFSMKKAVIYLAMAALMQVATTSTGSSQSGHSSIPVMGHSARTPSSGLRPIFPRHRHHKRFHRFDFAYTDFYPDWLYAPDSGQTAETPYEPGAEYSAPPIPTKCVPEAFSVPSEVGGGQAHVTVTRCNVPILIPGSGPPSPRSGPPSPPAGSK
jgi:hypothetical protein